MNSPSKDLMAAIAVTRFGLGARPGEIESAVTDPQGWLLAQVRSDGANLPQGDNESSISRVQQLQAQRQLRTRLRKSDPEAALQAGRDSRDQVQDDLNADFLERARFGASTPASFSERWALFWSNHFTVSATKRAVSALAGPFEKEAIRPHIFGGFESLLIASSTHPAMLTYLDQDPSIGPNSLEMKQRRQGSRGLNENLAREILELHTVGVDAGYTQSDVTEFARALTGFSIARATQDTAGRFAFQDRSHEPGVRKVFGKTYAEGGVEQGVSILKTLATDPHTARHISRKIARHFIADDPPPALVAHLEKRWIDTSGDLSEVAKALIQCPEAWDPTPAKFKTPYEFALSTWRAIGAEPAGMERLQSLLNGQGQRPFSPPSPKGWADDAQAWASPGALVKRMQWAQGMAAAVADRADPNALAVSALGARLTDPVAKAVSRAETRREAFALLVMSPEFQRR